MIEVVLTPDDNDTLLATRPDVPEVTSFGETEEDALKNARDAIVFALDIRIREREALPAFRRPRKGATVVDLGSRVAMKVKPSEIDRLLDLGYKTGIDQLDAALAAQGLAAEVKVIAAR